MMIEYTPRSLLLTLFRHSALLLMVFTSIVTFGVAYAFLSPPVYEVTGSLLVKFGSQPSSAILSHDSQPSIISQNDRREVMQSNMDILQSKNLLMQVVHEVGVEKIYPGITNKVGKKDLPEEAAVRKMLQTDLIVKSNIQSNVIDVVLTSRDPEVSATFLSLLFDRFIQRQSEIYNKPQIGFLEEQVKRAAAKLDQSQLALKKFKARTGISSIETELNRLLEQKGDTSKISLEPNDDAWNKLADLREKEAQILSTYQPNSPQAQRIHRSVEQAEALLNERKSDLASRTGNVTGKIDARIRKLEDQRKQYNDLERQVELDEKNYNTYQQRIEEARVNETLNEKSITPISVIDEPTVPVKPVRPRRLLILLMSLFAGTVISLGTVLLRETMNTRFMTPEQLAHTIGVPVLASFSDPYRRHR